MDKVYENQGMVDLADKLAEEITSEKKSNSYRDHFFPALIDKLALKSGAEIGVDKCEFSVHLLNRSQLQLLNCIDTWQDDFGSDHRPDYFDKDGNVRFEEAQANINQRERGDVNLIRLTSVEAATLMDHESLDFAYIDGDHSLEGIYADLKAWAPKVRVGGIVAGHDYKDGPKSGINDYFGEQLPYAIETVTNYYCRRYGYKLNVVGGRIKSWWFIKNRPTEDHLKMHLLPNLEG